MKKLQTQGVHHITIVGADRKTSIDFWEGLLGMPFVFEQPNLDNGAESHLYFDPGDGRLVTVFTNEERVPDPSRVSREPGNVQHLAFALSQATFYQAVERLDERGVPHSGVKDRGFMDSIYFDDPLGLLIELASYRFEPPFGCTPYRTSCSRRITCACRGATTTSTGRTSRTRSRRSSCARGPPSPTTAYRRTPTAPDREDHMANTLSILKPSVNNLTTRIFVRAAGLDYDEIDVWGKKSTPEFLAKDPADLTPLLEEDGLPRGVLWRAARSCSTSATATASTASTRPTLASERWSTARCSTSSGRSTPSSRARPTRCSGSRSTRGEVATSAADDEMKATAQKDAEAALAGPLEVYRALFLDGRRFIGGETPSIADIRFAASLEFLRAIDYAFPAWAEQYMTDIEAALGDVYCEPAADVRGYVDHVKGQSA